MEKMETIMKNGVWKHAPAAKKPVPTSTRLSAHPPWRRPNVWETRAKERTAYHTWSDDLGKKVLDLEECVEKRWISFETHLKTLERITREISNLISWGRRVIETQRQFFDLSEELEKITSLQSWWRMIIRSLKRQLRKVKAKVFTEKHSFDDSFEEYSPEDFSEFDIALKADKIEVVKAEAYASPANKYRGHRAGKKSIFRNKIRRYEREKMREALIDRLAA